MDIANYQWRLERSLSGRPGIVGVERADFDRLSTHRAKIAFQLRFIDDSRLALKQTLDSAKCYPDYLKYSYEYLRAGRELFRYDNSPHHPEVSTHPHHKHTEPDQDPIASHRPSISDLFREILDYLRR